MRIRSTEVKLIFDSARSENNISTESAKLKDAKQKLDSKKVLIPKDIK
jgi:hypothetical protein